MKPQRLSRLLLPFVTIATALGIVLRTSPFDLESLMNRRRFIKAGLALTAVAGTAWRSRSPAVAARSVAAPSGGSCVLTPEQTQGPYYIAKEKVRPNIREKRPGTPLKLRLTVMDQASCTPIKGAAVDIWHCDGTGIYSGFESASTGAAPGGGGGPTDKDTFLRGIQVTDAKGRVEFETIYPGWYAGRTVHIHVKVHRGGNVVHTGQLFFPDTLTDKVYQTGVYKARAAGRTTRNNQDGIFAQGGRQSMLSMKHVKGGYTGTISMGVRRA